MPDYDHSNRATWELTAMANALSHLRALNTEAEEAELKAIKVELIRRRKAASKPCDAPRSLAR